MSASTEIRSVTPTSIPVRLASDSAHGHHIQVEYLGLGVVFGSLLLLIAACVVQAWVYRDAVYGWIARRRKRWFPPSEACLILRPEWRSRFIDPP